MFTISNAVKPSDDHNSKSTEVYAGTKENWTVK